MNQLTQLLINDAIMDLHGFIKKSGSKSFYHPVNLAFIKLLKSFPASKGEPINLHLKDLESFRNMSQSEFSIWLKEQ